MSRILAVLMLAVFSIVAIADDISTEDKAKAQLTLAKWMKSRSDDNGRFLFVDRQTNDLMGGYSANVHPMIVPRRINNDRSRTAAGYCLMTARETKTIYIPIIFLTLSRLFIMTSTILNSSPTLTVRKSAVTRSPLSVTISEHTNTVPSL